MPWTADLGGACSHARAPPDQSHTSEVLRCKASRGGGWALGRSRVSGHAYFLASRGGVGQTAGSRPGGVERHKPPAQPQ